MTITEFRLALIANGGASLNLVTEDFNPKSGYFVSVKGREQQIPLESLTDSLIESYITVNNDQLFYSKNKNRFLGGWVNEGIVYLDVSVQFLNLEIAKFIGKVNNQIAIFDASEQEVIVLD